MNCEKPKPEKVMLIGVALACLLVTVTLWMYTINQPLLDFFSFRQCQTAMSSYWMDLGGGWSSVWNYITPEFGEPWSIPFEFPLYQYLVKLLSVTLYMPLDPAGRFVSCLFFMAAILLGVRFLFKLGFTWEVFLPFFILSICSPFYIYWSRSFMIESCAVFFGLLMLVSVQEYFNKRNYLWLIMAILASVTCALVKVTTYPSYFLVAIFFIYFTPLEGSNQKNIYRHIALLSVLVAVPFVIIWTHHADSIKASNELTKYLTSKNLALWNYGTFAQRCSRKLWVDVIVGRAIPEILGSIWLALFIIAGLLFSATRTRFYILIFITAFIIPFLLFPNLHIIHNYYQYANGLWLLMALAVAVYVTSRRLPRSTGPIVILVIVCFELCVGYRLYWREMNVPHEKDNVISAADAIKSSTLPDSSILIIGDDWSPELGYYSNRRSVYYPDWLNLEQARLAFSNQSILSGKYPLSAVVIRRNSPSGHKNSESWSFVREWAEGHAKKEVYGDYDIYFIRNKS